MVFSSGATLNIGDVAPSGSKAKRAYITVTEAFNGSTESTLQIGVAGSTDSIAKTTEIDLHTLGEYEIICNEKFASNTQIIATYAADGATQGAAEIVVELVKV